MLSTSVKTKVRKTNHKLNETINVPRSVSTYLTDQTNMTESKLFLTFDKSGKVSSPYSGPDPQILPFPPELIARVLGYVDRPCDKRNARLVCKGFAAAGLSSLTSKVHFSTSLIGIDYSSKVPHLSSPTLEIAMHPVVSKYITTMVCEGTQLSDSFLAFPVFQDWCLTLCKPQTLWPLENLHSIYTTRYAQEGWLTKEGEDQKIFRRALEKFPKLDCILFRDIKTNGPRDWPRPTWPLAIPKGDL